MPPYIGKIALFGFAVIIFGLTCFADDVSRPGASTNDENPESWTAPNKKFSISTAPSANQERYRGLLKVELRDAKNRLLDSYDPETRAIEVFWSPDSRYVAINEDIAHCCGNLSVWLTTHGKFEKVDLPEAIRSKGNTPAIDRLIPAKDAKQLIIAWHGAVDAWAGKWRSDSDLEVSVDGGANLHSLDPTSSKEIGWLEVEYRFVIRCSEHNAEVIGKEKIKYEKQLYH